MIGVCGESNAGAIAQLVPFLACNFAFRVDAAGRSVRNACARLRTPATICRITRDINAGAAATLRRGSTRAPTNTSVAHFTLGTSSATCAAVRRVIGRADARAVALSVAHLANNRASALDTRSSAERGHATRIATSTAIQGVGF